MPHHRLLRPVLAVSAVAITSLFLISLTLSDHYTVTRSITIQTSPERIFDLLETPREWRKWGAWNQRDPQMTVQYAGPERGRDAAWSWQGGRSGNGNAIITRTAKPNELHYIIRLQSTGTDAEGTFRLERGNQSTRVTWSMEGHLGDNPLYRYFGLFADRLMGPDLELSLTNLKTFTEKGK
ncbi:SRPBCC family protein [Burkholderiaceae bacterium DAT-1]|nr:SRPBCC family protein [Burkholderiaceae bacterium DAT-1]